MKNDVFAGMRTPQAPDDLRERVLGAAHAAVREPVSARERRWHPAPFDLAWVTALLVLVLCHALLSFPRRPVAVAAVKSQAVAEERQLEKEFGLPSAAVVVASRIAETNGEAQRQLMEELERL